MSKDNKVKLLISLCVVFFVIAVVFGLWTLALHNQQVELQQAMEEGKSAQELLDKQSTEKFNTLEEGINALNEKISDLEGQLVEKDAIITERNNVITTMATNMDQISQAYQDLITRINQAPPEQTLESLQLAIEGAASSLESSTAAASTEASDSTQAEDATQASDATQTTESSESIESTQP